MKSSCPHTVKKKLPVAIAVDPLVPPKKTPPRLSSPQPEIHSPPSPTYPEKFDSEEEEQFPAYKIEISKGDKKNFVKYKNEVLVVYPPELSDRFENGEDTAIINKCVANQWHYIAIWGTARVSEQDMMNHFKKKHKGYRLVAC